MAAQSVNIGNRRIEMDNLEKVIFPDISFKQGDLLNYYRRIGEVMLPYLKDRPLTLQRFPDGISESGFYQKKAPDYFPDWIERVEIRVEENEEKQPQVVCNNPATLAYLVDQGCISLHIWQSRTDRIRYPDRLIFDLDPPGDDFEKVRLAAQKLHELLRELELISYVMTTGSQGLHVVVPLQRRHSFEKVRNFAHQTSQVLAQRYSDEITVEVQKNQRKGRLFLDYMRNTYGQNSIAPYSVRALPQAPVATPLDWEELGNRDLNAQSYTVKNLFRRMGQKEDPWKGMMKHARSLKEPLELLEQQD